MSDKITQKVAELQALRATAEMLAGQLQAPAIQPDPTPYDHFAAIFKAAADSAERADAAAKMVETYWFNGAEWLGGEYTTMQIWDASLRFAEQAIANGYEWTAAGWQRDGKGWSQAAVVKKVEEMVQR
jgi:hypothetical protein